MSREEKTTDFMIWGLFFIYLAFLVWIILFKFSFSYDELRGLQYRNINLIPYNQSLIVNGHLNIAELWKNILIFFPLGLYLGILKPEGKKWKKIIVIACISAGLEIMQYILAIGASDITDIINNSIGGILGLFAFSLLSRILGRRTYGILKILALLCTMGILCILIALIFVNI